MGISTARFALDAEIAEPETVCDLCASRERSERAVGNK